MPKKTLVTIDKARTTPDAYAMDAGNYCMATLADKNVVSPYEARKGHLWEHCRESFARNWALVPNQPFIMSLGTNLVNQKESLAKFLRITEEKKLKLQEFSKISGFVNDNYAILIEPAAWWTTSELRRQFLTALLRAGLFYYKNPSQTTPHNPAVILPEYKDYRKAVHSVSYFAETSEAVRKFLRGYTTSPLILKGGAGWVNVFSNPQNLNSLVKPND